MGASKVLGIVGICTGWFIPLSGLILGIIGLSIKKEKGKEERDKGLNIISIVESLVFWFMYFVLIGVFA